MRALRIVSVLLLAFALPAAVFAQTSSTDSQASALIAQITALEQEIQSVTGASVQTQSAPPVTTTSYPSSSSSSPAQCPNIYTNLSLGSSGPQVSSLQVFLVTQGDFNANVTGYFGTITQSAVEAWQAEHNIVSGGSPSTTGFGVVGPRTRADITALCAGESTTQDINPYLQNACITTQPPLGNCPTGWQPVTGSNGCTAYYQCSIPLPNATSTVSATTSTPNENTQTCPTVPQPECIGQVVPFQTGGNGCVLSYQCVF